jgi:hypothetical protein
MPILLWYLPFTMFSGACDFGGVAAGGRWCIANATSRRKPTVDESEQPFCLVRSFAADIG